ncbi:hypothetical protein [Shouchella lehensis]|uniref:Uncharacterized protein n=2 Tax=Shouchella lehensis TaxID=300825 RepID=A0A060LWX8_9BACI|nr:hypothetical protein [Shouchella lehensis]AIC94280.1 hypothetical protein BleG1_1702 [Shouchella lehensis G1]MBG9785889.1 hypothetical protein [Shouchella lehensis]RQW20187.1 hypothetical protein EH196_08605 [Bacillus sp. C1-1]TES48359.1 hypothetical protein E2L03_14680 [Shouchella lehensis]
MHDQSETANHIIKSYQQDEQMMILVFSQWCINNDYDPAALYSEAYPEQGNNHELKQALALTVSKEESSPIATETVINLLQVFGNEDLAYLVQTYSEKGS